MHNEMKANTSHFPPEVILAKFIRAVHVFRTGDAGVASRIVWICFCHNIPDFPYVVVKFLRHILYSYKKWRRRITYAVHSLIFFTEKLNIKLSRGLLSDLSALKETRSKTQVMKTRLSAETLSGLNTRWPVWEHWTMPAFSIGSDWDDGQMVLMTLKTLRAGSANNQTVWTLYTHRGCFHKPAV